MEKQEMIQDDKSAPNLELVKLIYHTTHKAAEDTAIPIPIVVSALVHAASVMAQIYDCRESFDSAIKVNRLEASRLEEIRGGYHGAATPKAAERLSRGEIRFLSVLFRTLGPSAPPSSPRHHPVSAIARNSTR